MEELIDPNSIRQHLLNIQIYGDHIEDDFVENIRQYGVRTPLLVCQSNVKELDGVVVCGRRRMLAARLLDIKVPVRYWRCDDKLEVEETLILDNVHNPCTNEEKIRMYEHLKKILIERGHQNKSNGARGDAVANVNSRVDAAKRVGISHITATRGLKAVKKADELRASGDEEGADEIIETLNRSVKAAAEKSNPKEVNDIDIVVASLLATMQKADKKRAEFVRLIDEQRISYGKLFTLAENQGRLLGDKIDDVLEYLGVIKKSLEAQNERRIAEAV